MKNTDIPLYLFCMITLFIIGFLISLFGFFPISFGNDMHSTDELVKPSYIDEYSLQKPTKQYNQIFLMIVDAMRYDFLNNVTMPFSYQYCCSKIKLRADIPTVTMPRIKSLISGTLSSFSDIVLNLGSSEHMKDSLLHRLKIDGNTIVFGGDKTWVDLFPNIFKRHSANINSFYVNDFNESDKNLTSFIQLELQNIDWNFLIAHYLGLDHIGHVEGSDSPKIPLKLREMDAVINMVFTKKSSKGHLILITGDHGMRNGGGHGGSTEEELYVPLISFHQDCVLKDTRFTEFKQIDVTPTIAILMSTNIPTQSIGRIIPTLIQHMSLEDQLYAYYYNTIHLLKKAEFSFDHKFIRNSDFYKWLNSAKEFHKEFLRIKRSEGASSMFVFEKSKLNYMRASEDISKRLANTLVYFKYDFIFIGIILCSLVTMNITLLSLYNDPHIQPLNCSRLKRLLIISLSFILIIFISIFMEYIQMTSIYSWFLLVPISSSIYIFDNIITILQKYVLSCRVRCILPIPLPLFLCLVCYISSLASSSFIEEEHQTWLYLGTSILIRLCINSFIFEIRNENSGCRDPVKLIFLTAWRSRRNILMLLIITLLRKLNQTGDKWKHLVDLGDILNKDENLLWLSLFLFIGLLLLIISFRHFTSPSQHIICIIACSLIYCFRGTQHTVIFFELKPFSSAFHILPCFWMCIIFLMIINCYRSNTRNECNGSTKIEVLKGSLICFLLVSALLHKPHNVILLPAMLYVQQQSLRMCDHMEYQNNRTDQHSAILIYKIFTTIFISKIFFYYQGNSNSLATIDLNPGYVGQNQYNSLFVFVLVTLSTYNAHFNAFLFLLTNIFEDNFKKLTHFPKEKQFCYMYNNIKSDTYLLLVICTIATLLPATIYLWCLVLFRYHLFIYSVFAPKAVYELFNVVIYFFNFCITHLYLTIIKQ